MAQPDRTLRAPALVGGDRSVSSRPSSDAAMSTWSARGAARWRSPRRIDTTAPPSTKAGIRRPRHSGFQSDHQSGDTA